MRCNNVNCSFYHYNILYYIIIRIVASYQGLAAVSSKRAIAII